MHGYPFTDSIAVAIRQRRIPVRISGRGRPILFLHGYPLDSQMWDPLSRLLATDHLCIAPDLRGFGSSSEEAKSFSISDLADDCSALLDALQIRQPVIVCGLSMGGYVALQFTQRHAHRLDSLILTNTRANSDDFAVAANRRSVATKALENGSSSVVMPMLDKLLSPQTRSNQPEVVDLVRSMMLATRPSTIAWAQLAMAERQDFLERVPSWTMPVSCIAGAEDTIVPLEVMRQMSNRFGSSSFHILENSAHLSPLECPGEFAEIVRNSSSSKR